MVDISFSQTELTLGKDYYYYITAENTFGKTRLDGAQSFILRQAPTATGLSSTDIESTSAQLNGTAYGGGVNSTITFYAKDIISATYTAYTATPATTGTADAVSVSYMLTNLTLGHQYIYYLDVSNNLYDASSSTATFTVVVAPSASLRAYPLPICSFGPEDRSIVNVTLSGQVNANGSREATYQFLYGTDSTLTVAAAYPPSPVGSIGQAPYYNSPVEVSNTISSPLTIGETYYYRVSATNEIGTANSPIQRFLVATSPTITGGTADVNSTVRSVILTAAVFSNGADTSANFFITSDAAFQNMIYQSSQFILSTSANNRVDISFSQTDLTLGMVYYYYITAENTFGTTRLDGAQSFILRQAPSLSLVAMSSIALNPTLYTYNSSSNLPCSFNLVLTGTIAPNGYEISSIYFVWQNTNTAASPSSLLATNAETSCSATTTNYTFPMNVEATYYMVCSSNYNTIQRSDSILFITPSATTIKRTNRTDSSAMISGLLTPGTFSNAFSTVYFRYNTTSDLENGFQQITATQSLLDNGKYEYSMTGLEQNTNYYYAIFAVLSTGDTIYGSTLHLKTSTAPTAATLPNTGYQLTATSAYFLGQVNPNGNDASVNFIYGTDPTLTINTYQTPVNIIRDSGTDADESFEYSYFITTLTRDTTYYYKIQVLTSAGLASVETSYSFTTMPSTDPACWPQLDGSPNPTRLWSREQASDCPSPTAMLRKANILQYTNNSSKLTKKQHYSQMVKGNGPLGKKTWATQSDTYTNPNSDNFPRTGNSLTICASNPIGPIICIPTSSSDVPGPIIALCYNPSSPPISNRVRRTYLAGGTKWPQRTWSVGDNGFPAGKAGS